MDQVINLAMGQLEYYVDRADFHASNGNEELEYFFIQQGKDLVQSLNATDDEEALLYMTFHRLLADDEGALFLAAHSDPEFYA